SPLPVEPLTAERRVLPGRVRARSGSARQLDRAISCRWWESARGAPAASKWFESLFQRPSLPAYRTRQHQEPSTPVMDPTTVRTVTTSPDIKTLAQLRASGHVQKSVREELRDNLLAALADGTNPWPGLHGFERTVLPQLGRALIAGHDIVLLGERGQGKTRLLRTLASLLDEWTPIIAGSELHEHPYEPITAESQRMVESAGDDLPGSWLHRDDRYVEKLSTPATSVAALNGGVAPLPVAAGRRLRAPYATPYALVPPATRGILALHELPDLAPRLQLALLHVMEERDLRVRGSALRLPLAVLMVASANPEH